MGAIKDAKKEIIASGFPTTRQSVLYQGVQYGFLIKGEKSGWVLDNQKLDKYVHTLRAKAHIPEEYVPVTQYAKNRAIPSVRVYKDIHEGLLPAEQYIPRPDKSTQMTWFVHEEKADEFYSKIYPEAFNE